MTKAHWFKGVYHYSAPLVGSAYKAENYCANKANSTNTFEEYLLDACAGDGVGMRHALQRHVHNCAAIYTAATEDSLFNNVARLSVIR